VVGRKLDSRDESGLTIIEMVVAFSLLAIVVLAMTSSVAVGFNLVRKSKVDQIATQLANSEIERIRRIRDVTGETAEAGNRGGYKDIGTCTMQGGTCVPSGYPPGVIPASREKTVRGITYVITVDIVYKSDPVQGEPDTYDDYKLVTVSVEPKQPVLGKKITAKTIISPETSATPGTMRVTVVDAGGSGTQPVQGIEVRAAQGSLNVGSLYTDASGIALFAGLTPSATYDFTVVDSGPWKKAPPSVSDCPATVSRTLNPLEEDSVTLCVYKPVQLTVNVSAQETGASITDHNLAVVMESNGKFAANQRLYSADGSPPELSSDKRTWSLTGFGVTNPFAAGMRYYLAAWAPGYAPAWVEVVPAADEVVELALAAAASGAVAVHVNAGGAPVPGAWVSVRRAMTDTVRYAVTRPDGGVVVDLEPGIYTVEAQSTAGIGTAVATVSFGSTTPVNLTLS
jgi:type II secretory pathway pseudopilin PulG